MIRTILKDELLPNLKIHEIFLFNIDELVDNFSKLVEDGEMKPVANNNLAPTDLQIIQDPQYRRVLPAPFVSLK